MKEPPLSAKLEAFARACADGMKGAVAYRKHVSNRGTVKTQHEMASKLLATHKVAARVSELRAMANEIATRQLLLTKEESLRFLTDIVRTPIGQIDEHSVLTLELRRTRRVVGKGKNAEVRENEWVKMPGKIDAIKQAAAMCGWNEPEVAVITPMSWDSILELATKSAVFRKTVAPLLRELLGKIEKLA